MVDFCVIALSGGVDSTVAALLLRQRFSYLAGATHYIWPNSRCCSLDVFKRASYLAEKIFMPYFVIDLHQAFKEKVVADFISSYLEGVTPNPCVICNEEIRFGLFYEELQKKLLQEKIITQATRLYFATGHYARIVSTPQGCFIAKGRDPKKDQSYMLYRLPKTMLSNLIFPLGEMLKKDVIEIARQAQFSVAEEKESQDACFVDDDYVDFIGKETGRQDLNQPGRIVDLTGNTLGSHHGFIHYTVGQRRGLGLGNGPWYVVGIRASQNEIVVSRRDFGFKAFNIKKANWFIPPPQHGLACSVKIRYQGEEIPALVTALTSEEARVELKQKELITPGQSAVFYQGEIVLGGGIIQPPENNS